MKLIDFGLTDTERTKLFAMRGGCRCVVPDTLMPCPACATPITDDEARQLGINPEWVRVGRGRHGVLAITPASYDRVHTGPPPILPFV